jgi:hypothetical protein
VVWFRHQSAGAGLVPVSGLPLLTRSCLEAVASGFSPVLLAVPAADAAAARRALAERGPRLAAVEVLADEVPVAAFAGDPATETVVLFGDAVWDRSLTREAKQPLPAGCPARVWTGPAGDVAFARVRSDRLPWLLDDPELLDLAGALRERIDAGRIARVVKRADVPAAEAVLLRGLRKPADGVFSRHLSRPVSLMITARLARFPVRPNHVTALVACFCVGAALLAAGGTRAGFVAAACCWWFAAILDGCDGELARLKYLGTRAGAWMDTIVDDLSLAACIVGLAAGLRHASGNDQWLAVGGIGLAGFCLTYPPRWYLFARDLHAGDHQLLAVALAPSGLSGVGALAHWVKQTVVRNDFLPYFVLAGVLAGAVPLTLVGLTLAMLFGVADTAMTFFVWRPRWVAAGLEQPNAG